jgi:hypothetical protein
MVGKLATGTAAAVVAVGVAKTAFASKRPNPSAAGSKGSPDAEQAKQVAEQSVQSQTNVGPQIVDAESPATASAPAPWALIRPLSLGSTVGHGWHVAGLTGAVDGSCVLTLENERGRAHRIHVCRNQGQPQGLVYTKQFDLVVMNGGQGDLPTEEGLAQAVARVAHVLADNESDLRHQPIVTALLPQAERVRRFSGTVDRRLR